MQSNLGWQNDAPTEKPLPLTWPARQKAVAVQAVKTVAEFPYENRALVFIAVFIGLVFVTASRSEYTDAILYWATLALGAMIGGGSVWFCHHTKAPTDTKEG